MIEFDCPTCAAPIKVAAVHAGKKGKCSKCGMQMTIPGVPEGVENEFFNVLTAEVKEHTTDAFLAEVTGPRESPALEACPDCRNLVSLRARGCPHCGAPLHGTPPLSGKEPFGNLQSIAKWDSVLGTMLAIFAVLAILGGILLLLLSGFALAGAAFASVPVLLFASFWLTVRGETIRLALAIEEHLRAIRYQSKVGT
jgi:hypothetical protein